MAIGPVLSAIGGGMSLLSGLLGKKKKTKVENYDPMSPEQRGQWNTIMSILEGNLAKGPQTYGGPWPEGGLGGAEQEILGRALGFQPSGSWGRLEDFGFGALNQEPVDASGDYLGLSRILADEEYRRFRETEMPALADIFSGYGAAAGGRLKKAQQEGLEETGRRVTKTTSELGIRGAEAQTGADLEQRRLQANLIPMIASLIQGGDASMLPYWQIGSEIAGRGAGRDIQITGMKADDFQRALQGQTQRAQLAAQFFGLGVNQNYIEEGGMSPAAASLGNLGGTLFGSGLQSWLVQDMLKSDAYKNRYKTD